MIQETCLLQFFFDGGSFTINNTTINSTGSGNDAFSIKLNSVGTLIWAKLLGFRGDQSIEDILIDGAYNLIIAGSVGDSISL
jgi:hypothetical protein